MAHPNTALAANEPHFNERGLQDARIPPEADIQRGMMQAPGQSFSDWLESRVARFSTRRYDWDALKFQADYNPKYRRAQMRYMGTGGTGVASDSNTVPASHFTFSTMVIPAGNIGPSHIHYDVEEVFFVMRGKMKVICEKDGQRWEAELAAMATEMDRGLVTWTVTRGAQPPLNGESPPLTDPTEFLRKLGEFPRKQLFLINIGDEDALMCVMLGSPQPITPVYPPDSPLAKIKREMLAR